MVSQWAAGQPFFDHPMVGTICVFIIYWNIKLILNNLRYHDIFSFQMPNIANNAYHVPHNYKLTSKKFTIYQFL